VGPGDGFSSDLAWSELETLAALGPRPIGSEAALAARRHIRDRLEGWGIEVHDVSTTSASEDYGPLALDHLVATLPGRSADRIVLVAPYDSGEYGEFVFEGVNDGASGAALLVELARVLSGRERPYTIDFVWLAGEGRLGRASGAARELRWLGSAGLAEQWAEEGRLRGIRLLAVFNRICDADLRIARDLGSHRAHREEFWRAARRLGRSAAFAPAVQYESFASSHSAFSASGLRRVVAIEDTAFGGDEAPGLYAGKEDRIEHCAPESLETVGLVTLEAIDTIGKRLAKIDRFARMPTAEPETEVPAPAPEIEATAPEPETEASEPAPAPEGEAIAPEPEIEASAPEGEAATDEPTIPAADPEPAEEQDDAEAL
jgi:hypothetical protein